MSLPSPPIVGGSTTPARRRQADPSNLELLSSLTNNDNVSSDDDDSKNRRNLHFQLGPLVISGAAIDRVMARFLSFTSRLTMDTLRPLPMFLGVTGPSLCISADAFSPPFSLRSHNNGKSSNIISRLSWNLNYFATNYAFVAVCTFLVVALMHPGMLLYATITYTLWWLHIIVIREDLRLVIMDKDLNQVFNPKRRAWILSVFTLWVAIAKCVRPSIKGMAISLALILFHALMRDPSKLAKNIVATQSRSLSDSSSEVMADDQVMVEKADAAV